MWLKHTLTSYNFYLPFYGILLIYASLSVLGHVPLIIFYFKNGKNNNTIFIRSFILRRLPRLLSLQKNCINNVHKCYFINYYYCWILSSFSQNSFKEATLKVTNDLHILHSIVYSIATTSLEWLDIYILFLCKTTLIKLCRVIVPCSPFGF